MNRAVRTSAVAVAGLATSVTVAVANTLFHSAVGFEFFGLSFFMIVPIGAIACGFAAASGYYLGAKLLQIQPEPFLLVQMVAIAAATMLLIYWLEYQTLNVDGVHVADVVPFGRYLDLMLTTQRLSFARLPGLESDEIGSLGYMFAVRDFIGFLIGGGAIYLLLKREPACEACGKYLRAVVKKVDFFPGEQALAAYYQGELEHPIDSPEFAQHVGHRHVEAKVGRGDIWLDTRVIECPNCRQQTVVETAKIHSGSDWELLDGWQRRVRLPEGADVRRAYAGLATEA